LFIESFIKKERYMSIGEGRLTHRDPLADIQKNLDKLDSDLKKPSDATSRATIREDVHNLNEAFSRAVMQDPDAEGLEKLHELTEKFTLKNKDITTVNSEINKNNDTIKPNLWQKFLILLGIKEAPNLEENIHSLVSEKDMSKLLFLKFENIIEAKVKKEEQDIKLTPKITRDATNFSIQLSENGRIVKELSFKVGDNGYLIGDKRTPTIKDLLENALQTIEEEKNVQASLASIKHLFESSGFPKESAADAEKQAQNNLMQASKEDPSNVHLYSLAKTGDRNFTLFTLPIDLKTGSPCKEQYEITGEGKFKSTMTNQEYNLDELQETLQLEKAAFESLIETRETHTRESVHFNDSPTCKTKAEAEALLKEMHKLNKTEGYYFTWQDTQGHYYLAAISNKGSTSHFTLSFNNPLGSIHFMTNGDGEAKASITEFAKDKGYTASLSNYNRQKLMDDMKDYIDPRKGLAIQTRANDAIYQMTAGQRYALLSTDSETEQNVHHVTVTILEREDPGVFKQLFTSEPKLKTAVSTYLINDNGMIVVGDMKLTFDQFKQRILKDVKPFELDEAYAALEDAAKTAGFPIASSEQKMQFFSDIETVLGNERFLEQPALMLYSQNGQLQLAFTNAEGKLVEAAVALKNNKLEVTLPGWFGSNIRAQTKTYSTFAGILKDSQLFPTNSPLSMKAYQEDIAIRKEIMQMVPVQQDTPVHFASYVKMLGDKANGAFAFYTAPRPASTLKDELHLAYISGGKVLDKVFDTTSFQAFQELKKFIAAGKKDPTSLQNTLIENSPVKGAKPMLDAVKSDYEKIHKRYIELTRSADAIYTSGKESKSAVTAALEKIISIFPEKAVGAYALVQQEGYQGKFIVLVVEKDNKVHSYEIDLLKEPGRIAILNKPTRDNTADLKTALKLTHSLESFSADFAKRTEKLNKIVKEFRATVNPEQLQRRANGLKDAPNFWCVSQRPEENGNYFIMGFKKEASEFIRVEYEFKSDPKNEQEVLAAAHALVGDKAITAAEVENRFQIEQKQQENRKKELERSKETEKQERKTVSQEKTTSKAASTEPVMQESVVQKAPSPLQKVVIAEAPVIKSSATKGLAAAQKPTAPTVEAKKSILEEKAEAIIIPGDSIIANLRVLQSQANKPKLDAIIKAKDAKACQILLGKIQGPTMPAVRKGFLGIETTVNMQFGKLKDSESAALKNLFNKILLIAQGKSPSL
jgi:hypothetical protein